MTPLARTRRRRLHGVASALVLVLTLGAADCNKEKKTAYADCRNLEKYQSGFGILNAPQFDLGAVVDLNTQTRTGGRIRTLNLANTDIKLTDPIDSASILSNADFKLAANANIPAAVEAEAEAYLNNHTLLSLNNYRRKDIADPGGALSRDGGAATDIASRLRAPAGHVYLLVSSLILADGLSFAVADKAGINTKAKVITAQNYELTIDYSCEATLAQRAHQGPLLFKVVQLDLAPDGTIRPVALTEDLKYYNLNPAIMAR